MNISHLPPGGIKGGGIDALLVGILTEFKPLFGLFEGTVAAVDGRATDAAISFCNMIIWVWDCNHGYYWHNHA